MPASIGFLFPVRNADSCLVMYTEIWSNADAIYVLMDFYLHEVIDKTFGVCMELSAFTFTIFFSIYHLETVYQ